MNYTEHSIKLLNEEEAAKHSPLALLMPFQLNIP